MISSSRLASLLVLVLAAGPVVAACGGSGESVSIGADPLKGDGGGETDGGGGASDAGTPCKGAADCGPSALCAFPPGATCGSEGVCIAQPAGPTCALVEQGCSCGVTVTIGCVTLPSGYTPYPEFKQPAPGTSCSEFADAGGTCTTDADCGSDGVCGFARADGCTSLKEVGTCFPKSGANCNSVEPGCACDGTMINLACNYLPGTYAPKPLRHAGACADGG